MTPSQLSAIKADILANGDMNTLPANSDGSDAISKLYNSPASPAYPVWRTRISVDEIKTAIIGTEFIALTVAKQNLFLMLLTGGDLDASNANIRGCFSAVFAAGTTLTNLTNMAQRPATRLEKLLATGMVLGFEGSVNYQIIETARA